MVRGGGKTTISLMLSKLFVACGKKVLLVDCDLATQGVSCFLLNKVTSSRKTSRKYAFLNHIVEKTNSNDKDYQLISNREGSIDKIMEISDIYLLPCDMRTKEEKPIVPYPETLLNIINRYLNEKFDIIIFDCQAGYNILSKELVNISDSVLFVYEDDAVSETTTDLLRVRLTDDAMDKQKFLLLNKCTDTKKRKGNHNNQLYKYLTPISYSRNIVKKFIYDKYIDIDFKKVFGVNKRFLLEVEQVAEECFPEYKNELLTLRADIKKYFFKRNVVGLCVFASAIVVSTMFIVLPFLN